MAYLDLYKTMYEKHENFEVLFRGQFERAVATVGLDFRSDPLWDRYETTDTAKARFSSKNQSQKFCPLK